MIFSGKSPTNSGRDINIPSIRLLLVVNTRIFIWKILFKNRILDNCCTYLLLQLYRIWP